MTLYICKFAVTCALEAMLDNRHWPWTSCCVRHEYESRDCHYPGCGFSIKREDCECIPCEEGSHG